MFINKKLNISKIFFFNMLLIATLSSTIIGLVWIKHEQQDFNKQAILLKSEYLDAHKQEVKNAVENAVNYINYKKELTEVRLKEKIRQRVYEAYGIAENIYQTNFKKLPDKQIISLIKQALRPVRFFDNRNYYFIDDLDGNSILFPPNHAFEGKNLMHIVNKEGVRPFPDIIKLVKENKEGYYIYKWVKYTEGRIPTDKEYPKITYFKLFDPYNWFIAVGEYRDYIEDDIKKEILERVSQIKIKNSGYVNIHTYDGIKLVSNGKVLKKPVNEWKKIDSKGNTFIQEENKVALSGHGGFTYSEINDRDKDSIRPRVSFARGLSDQQWVISAGIYIDEIDKVLEQKESILKKDEKKNLLKIIFIMIGLWLFALILARYISFKSKASFEAFSDFFKKASAESIRIDQNALHFSEFSELAISANQMIDERQKAELMLKKSEVRFRQLAENINEVFWIVPPNWEEIIYISPAYEEVWGQSCESLYQNPKMWMDSIVPEDLKKVNDYLDKISSDEISKIVFPEYRILKPDGTLRWIFVRGFPILNEAGEVYRITGIAEDITEKKHSEQAMQTIIESSAGIVGIEFFDKVVGLLSSWLNCDVALIGELKDETKIETIAMIADGQLNYEFSYDLSGTPCEIVQKDGFCFYPENIISLFPDDKDLATFNANGYVGTQILNHKGEMIGILNLLSREKLSLPPRAKDILNIIAARISAEIERKNIENEKDDIEAKLRQSQKMESVGTIAGGIAHDFNNILGIIIGNVELAIDDLPDDNPAGSNLDEIKTASFRARDIVKQLLNFSHKSEVNKTPTKIEDIVQETIKLLRASIPTTIEITLNISKTLPSIAANPTQLNQIIINLCTNAAHAMEKNGGILTISLDEIELDSAKFNGYQTIPEGRYVQLTVSDTGEGIDPVTLKRVFDPYFTTKPVGKGTGMGLSVAHGIVKNHDGGITIYSEPQKGTSVKVVFPAISKNPAKEKNIAEQLQTGSERILFVDDEESLIKMGKNLLQRLGYHVETFTDPMAALESFKSNPEQFDLMITDVTMPKLTGDQLSKRILEIRPDLPIILCSGFSERIANKSTNDLGVKKYIEKPLDRRKLAKTIRDVLDQLD